MSKGPIIRDWGIEIPLGLPEHMPQQQMTHSPDATDEDHDIFLELYYRVNVEALDEWAAVTSFMRGSIGCVAREPEITGDFKQLLIRMYGLQLGGESSLLPNNNSQKIICYYN